MSPRRGSVDARGRHATLPPVLVQCGGAEVLAGESRAFGAAAMDAGWSDVEVQEWVDMPHVFQVFDAVASEGRRRSVRGGVRGAGHGEMSPSRRGGGAVEASIVRGGGGVVRRERVATNAAA